MNTEILGRIATLSNDIAGILISLMFYNGWLKRRDMDKTKYNIGILIVALILIIGNQTVRTSVSFLTIAIFIYISIPLIFNQGKVWIRVTSGLFFASLGIISELLAALLFSVSYSLPISDVASNQLLYTAGSIASRLILLLMVQIFLLSVNIKAQRLSIKYWILIILMPVLSMIITVALFRQVDLIGYATPLMLISAIAVLYINLIAFWLFSRINNEYEKIIFMEKANQQLLLQQHYYNEIQGNYKATRGLWHDLRNNLLIIRGGLKSGKLKEVEEHVDSLLEEVNNPISVNYSGNIVVDSLLYDKVRKAEQNDIEIKFEISISKELNLPPEDISTILGNALDNALESCIRSKKEVKTIFLQLIEDKNNLVMYIKNTLDPKNVKKDKDKYVSSKRSKNSFGFGIYNMEQAVKNHGGNLKILFNDSYFEVKILIPISPK